MAVEVVPLSHSAIAVTQATPTEMTSWTKGLSFTNYFKAIPSFILLSPPSLGKSRKKNSL